MTDQKVSVHWDAMDRLLSSKSSEFSTELKLRKLDYEEVSQDIGSPPPLTKDGWYEGGKTTKNPLGTLLKTEHGC